MSIIIPTFNQEEYISTAINSALSQDYENIEIIVADDASTDKTLDIAKLYLKDCRVKLYVNSKNLGRVANYRKACYDYATGEWAVNLDGDDFYIDNSFISKAMSLIKHYKNEGYSIMFYQSGVRVDSKHGNKISVPNIPSRWKLIDGIDYFENFFNYNASCHLTTVYNRTKALSINYYSRDTLFTDLHSFLRLALHGRVILDKHVCGVWRIHSTNQTKQLAKYFQDELESRIDIANYASQFVRRQAADKWLAQACNQLLENLIYKSIKDDKIYFEDWKLYFKNFSLNKFFVIHFFKYIIIHIKGIMMRVIK